jgi:hypothetical protein
VKIHEFEQMCHFEEPLAPPRLVRGGRKIIDAGMPLASVSDQHLLHSETTHITGEVSSSCRYVASQKQHQHRDLQMLRLTCTLAPCMSRCSSRRSSACWYLTLDLVINNFFTHSARHIPRNMPFALSFYCHFNKHCKRSLKIGTKQITEFLPRKQLP